MNIYNLSKQDSILNHFVSEIRDIHIHNDSLRFRRNIERIGEVMAYELSKTLQYETKNIRSPLGIAPVNLATEPILLATVLRAGLPFHQGFLNYFDKAESAFVSAYRKYKEGHSSFDIHVEYLSSPKIDGKILVITDPMLATGASIELTYKALLSKGEPSHIHIATVIASKFGINAIKKFFPQEKTTVWAAAIDPELNEKAYIVPGLGDAGDLAYGIKN